ncbi:hypothetical protein Tco_0099220 [Tanacetum coccineum]
MMKMKQRLLIKLKVMKMKMDYTKSLLYDDVGIRLNELVDTDKGLVQEVDTDAAMNNFQQGNENPEISQVIEDAHVTLSTIPQKTKVPVTSSSHSSDLATHILLIVFVLVIFDSSPVFSIVILQSLPSFTPPPQQSTSIPPPTTKATNPPLILPDFASVFEFNNRATALEQEVAELKRILSTLKITKQVKGSTATDSARAKESSQPQSSYEAAATLTEFEMKKILIDKMDKSQSYLTASKHRECYDGLNKSYDLDKSLFSTYEPTDSNWNIGKTLQQGLTQSWLMTLASSAEKPSNTIDELLSTPIDFFAFIMNGLKINNLTQETLLGPAFRLLKGTRSNYAELKYDFEECYKALSEKLGDDVSDFAIALRMFTRSLVIQKRVEDFQLGVESYSE